MRNLLLLLIPLLGVAAAFFRPSQPFQVPRGGAVVQSEAEHPNFALMDPGLDNIEIQADGSIEAARKCGFCMGVSERQNNVLLLYLSLTPSFACLFTVSRADKLPCQWSLTRP